MTDLTRRSRHPAQQFSIDYDSRADPGTDGHEHHVFPSPPCAKGELTIRLGVRIVIEDHGYPEMGLYFFPHRIVFEGNPEITGRDNDPLSEPNMSGNADAYAEKIRVL
jgi:hypothetical protein